MPSRIARISGLKVEITGSRCMPKAAAAIRVVRNRPGQMPLAIRKRGVTTGFSCAGAALETISMAELLKFQPLIANPDQSY
ncbi:hypothetical protein [Afipia carboxidovorans]|uniref:hypothetical protein n=1 Tax=Afipia carboxidovorans TaxID=40137 RepID=UPI001FCC16AB|nr:hypothetical protein [Afipia carboxidovorans]